MKNALKKRDNLSGHLFILPAVLTFLAFIAIPFLVSLGLSFTEWNFLSGLKGIKWVGFDNFVRLASDKYFLNSIKNTFIYVIASVPVSLILALALAYVLNGKIYLRKTLRLAFFIPYISSVVAIAAVLRLLFIKDGPVNTILNTLFNMEPKNFVASATLVRIPVILILIMQAIGYELIVYMAALQDVPKELYESARLDGASGFQQFVKISVPLISPTTFYLVIVRTIAAFKIFAALNILTLATTNLNSYTMVLEIYEKAFSKYKFGYASAESLILFVILLIITLIQFWGQKHWVNYD